MAGPVLVRLGVAPEGADRPRDGVGVLLAAPERDPRGGGRLLGAGMTLAVGTAVVPLLFGAAPLTSWFWEAELPVLGHVEFVTSTLFDIGVYLVVIGLVLDVLRSLGGEVDRQAQALRDRGVSVS